MKKNTYPFIPLRDTVILPVENRSLLFGRKFSIAAIDRAINGHVVLGTQKAGSPDFPEEEHLYGEAVLCKIVEWSKAEGAVRASVVGLKRGTFESLEFGGCFECEFFPVEESFSRTRTEHLKTLIFEKLHELKKKNEDNSLSFLLKAFFYSDITEFTFAFANQVFTETEERVAVLRDPIEKTLEEIVRYIQGHLSVYDLNDKIEKEAKEKIFKRYEDVLKKGVSDDENKRIKNLIDLLPEEPKKIALEDLSRLQQTVSFSAETAVVKQHLDLILALPWIAEAELNKDFKQAERILNDSHYGLEEVKEEILKTIALTIRNPDSSPEILLLIGPPGVGKTSLCKAISEATNRPLTRISFAGKSDSANLLGQMRTYVGATPGEIIVAIKRLGVKNPIFLLDEVDKVDFTRDPTKVLVQVLDSEQNKSFMDVYLGVGFDLSKAIFVLTANDETKIAGEIINRVRKIYVDEYTEEEKLFIVPKLVEKARKNAGVSDREIFIEEEVFPFMIREYTLESGVRELMRAIRQIFEKGLIRLLEGEREIRVTEKNFREFITLQKVTKTRLVHKIGTATGLAWTPTGGDVLLIETKKQKGTGKLIVTGSVASVLKESVEVCFSLIKDIFESVNFAEWDFHVHFPAGAIKKDGPSAGVAIFSALVSLLKNKELPVDLAFSGEITLGGEILNVGGLKAKLAAAKRHGIGTVVLPGDCTLTRIPKELLTLEIKKMSTLKELLDFYSRIFHESEGRTLYDRST